MTHFIRRPAANLFGAGQIDWPNPRDSLGNQLSSNGSSKLWRATGPAKNLLVELRDRVLRLIASCGYESPSSAIWSFSLCMTGDCEDRARPHLLFVHNDIAVYLQIRKLIKDSGLTKDYPSVTIGQKNTLKLLAAGLTTHDSQLMATSSDLTTTIRISGNRLFDGHSPASVSTRHVATIGGIVRHGSEAFIFSAGHPFVSNSGGIKTQAGYYREDGDYETLGSGASPREVASIESSEHDQSRRQLDSDSHVPFSDVGTQKMVDEPLSLPQKVHQLNLNQCPGKETSSITSGNLDYSLFRLSDEAVEDLLVNQPGSRSPTNVLRRTNIVIPESDDDNVNVLCRTASGRFMTGKLDGTPSHIRLPNSSKLSEVYEVQFDGSLAQGDCGAWALDAGNGGLYGHLIAGLERDGSAYIMPARDVFDNVQTKLNQGLLVDCDIELEALLASDYPEFRIENNQASVVPKRCEQLPQITTLPIPDVMPEDLEHIHAIPGRQTASRQSAPDSCPGADFCRVRGKQIPSDENVQGSEGTPREIDAAGTPVQPDPFSEPQSHSWPGPSLPHNAWPAEFKRRRYLNYAAENVPYIEVAALDHDETMVECFMQDPERYHDGISHQVDLVTQFCRGTSLRTIQEQQDAPLVALVDERSFEHGKCLPRAYQGPLTASGLYELLKKKVEYSLLGPIKNNMMLTFLLCLALSSSAIFRTEPG